MLQTAKACLRRRPQGGAGACRWPVETASWQVTPLSPDEVLKGRFDPASDDWQMFTPADGLAHAIVREIHVTPEGVVWVRTEGGVSRVVPLE